MPLTLSNRIRHAANAIGREDKRGCQPCKDKMLAKGKDGKLLALLIPWKETLKRASINIAEVLPQIGFETHTIMRAQDDWKDAAVAFIEKRRPDLVVYWQRFYAGWGTELNTLLDEYAIPRLVMDFGVWPHYDTAIFDTMGENAASSVVGRLDALDATTRHRAAADAQMPLLEDMRATILRRAKEAEPKLADLGLGWLPEKFIFLCMQNSVDQVVLNDAPQSRRNSTGFVSDVCREARRQGKFVVIKTHPNDKTLDVPTVAAKFTDVARFLPQSKWGADNERIMDWLLVNCGYMATINSTVHMRALAVGTPVVAMGSGWFTGNNVVSQFSTIRGLINGPEELNEKRVERYLLHMLSRQLRNEDCKNPDKVKELLGRYFDFWATKKDITTITTMYAPDEIMEGIIRQCLDAIDRELPDSPKIAAVDYARPAFMKELEQRGMQIVTVDDGRPPRMSRILHDAVLRANTRLVMTIESDVVLGKDVPGFLLDKIKNTGMVCAAMEGRYHDANGNQTFPSNHRQGQHKLPFDDIYSEKRNVTFSAVLWKRENLVSVSWAGLPPLGRADIRLCERLRKKGMITLSTDGCSSLHLIHQSYKARNREREREMERKDGGAKILPGRTQEKTVVYTAIYGQKDRLKSPIHVEKNATYVCFTDDKKLTSPVWDVRYVPGYCDNPILSAKLFKVLPHDFFPETQISVWVDGSIQICGPIIELASAEATPEKPIRGFQHSTSKTVFDEAVNIKRHLREDPAKVDALVNWYKSIGYTPNGNGFILNGCLMRRHNTDLCINTMNDWWKMIQRWTCRDQMTLAYLGDKYNSVLPVSRDPSLYINIGSHVIESANQWEKGHHC